MALTRTTLATDCLSTDLTLKLASVTGATVGFPLKIDNEYIASVVSITSPYITVRGRGDQGTLAVAHKAQSAVELAALAGDFPDAPAGAVNLIPPTNTDVVTYGLNGLTLTVPNKDTMIRLTSTGTAYSLPIPSKAQDGLQLIVQAEAATAFVVTTVDATGATLATGYKNTKGTATFGGAIGDSMLLIANNAQWNPIAVTNVTFA